MTYRGLKSTERFESDKTSLVCCSFYNSIIYSYIVCTHIFDDIIRSSSVEYIVSIITLFYVFKYLK